MSDKDGPAVFSRAATAFTIASRQVSVRDAAQESHTPAAQFSVSKNQLIPQIGTVAARMAATGKPDLQSLPDGRAHGVACLTEPDGESEPPRQPAPHQPAQPSVHSAACWCRQAPLPAFSFERTNRLSQEQACREYNAECYGERHKDVPGHGKQRGKEPEAPLVQTHPAEMDGKQDCRERPDRGHDPPVPWCVLHPQSVRRAQRSSAWSANPRSLIAVSPASSAVKISA